MDFHIACALEFFVNHVIHAAACFDQCRCDDSQGATFFHVTCGTEEAFRTLEGVGIDATGQHLARGRNNGIVGTSQTGNGIQKDDNVFFHFDQTFCLFKNHFRNLDMARCRFVKCRCDDFAANGTLHFSHFFRTFVDQQDEEGHIGMIGRDGMCHVLQHHGFTGFRRSDQQTALAFADRGDHVDDTAGNILL